MKLSKTTVLAAALLLTSTAYAVPVTVLDENFDAGIPAAWSTTAITTTMWGLNNDAGNEIGNYTGGSGFAASVSSNRAGFQTYDASLITPLFSLDGLASASLDFLVNYQAFGTPPTSDNFDIDLSADGGLTWTTLLAIENDIGSFRSDPGGAINIDLAAFLGETSVAVRFRYYNPVDGDDSSDWYAQIDDLVISGELTAIPEPATVALLALALIGFGAARFKKTSEPDA